MTIYLSPKKYPDLASFSPEEKSAIINHVYASNHLDTWLASLTAGFSTFSITLSFRFFSALYAGSFGFLFFCSMLVGILVSLIVYLVGINTIFKRLVHKHISRLKNEE